MGLIRFRCSDDLEARVERAAKKLGLKDSELCRAVFEKAFPAVPVEDDSSEGDAGEEVYEGRTKKVTTQFTKSEWNAVRERAAKRGMKPYSWLFRLVRAHLTRTPQLNSDEVAALREATRELSYIGRNLNQVAHALNASFNARDQLTHELIADTNAQVSEVRASIKELLDQNLNRWGV